MAVLTYTKTGSKATTAAKLDKAVFDVDLKNHQLLKEAYLAYLTNGRTNNAVVKTRGLVSGGGRKPWRQKGTGRARFGSSRNPIWRGGGIVFGPTGQENYQHKLPLSFKRLALRQALSLAANENRIKVIEDFESKKGLTGEVAKLLSKLEISGTALLVVSPKTESQGRACRNLANLKLVEAKYLNVFDILNADVLLLTQPALSVIESWLKPRGGKA